MADINSALNEALKRVQIRDIPFADVVDDRQGPVYFEYAGRYYLSQREEGVIPTDPDKWSMVAASNFHHYYTIPGNPEAIINEDQLADIKDLHLDLKRHTLIESFPLAQDNFDVETFATLLKEKEKPARGLASNFFEFVEENKSSLQLRDDQASKARGIEAKQNYEDSTQLRKFHDAEAATLMFAAGKAIEVGSVYNDDAKYAKEFYLFKPAENAGGEGELEGTVTKLTLGTYDTLYQGQRVSEWMPVVEEGSLKEVLAEIKERGVIHAPNEVDLYLNGQETGFSDYLRQQARIFHAVKTEVDDKLKPELSRERYIGKETPLTGATSYSWYRVFREGDYVKRDQVHEPIAAGNELSGASDIRYLDESRADYFIITRERLGSDRFNILLFRGSEDGQAIPLQTIACKDKMAVAFKLQELGLDPDHKLIKIGDEEFARMRKHRDLDSQINVNDIDNLYQKGNSNEPIYDSISIKPRTPLTQPISVDAKGALSGDVEHLSTNTLYKLSETRYLGLFKGGIDYEPEVMLFERKGDTFTLEPANVPSSFAKDLATVLCSGATIKDASSKEVMALGQDLRRQAESSTAERTTRHPDHILTSLLWLDYKQPLEEKYVERLAEKTREIRIEQAVADGKGKVAFYLDKDNLPYFSISVLGEEQFYKYKNEPNFAFGENWEAVSSKPDGLKEVKAGDKDFHSAIYRAYDGKGMTPLGSAWHKLFNIKDREYIQGLVEKHLKDNDVAINTKEFDKPKEEPKTEAPSEEAPAPAAKKGVDRVDLMKGGAALASLAVGAAALKAGSKPTVTEDGEEKGPNRVMQALGVVLAVVVPAAIIGHALWSRSQGRQG